MSFTPITPMSSLLAPHEIAGGNFNNNVESMSPNRLVSHGKKHNYIKFTPPNLSREIKELPEYINLETIVNKLQENVAHLQERLNSLEKEKQDLLKRLSKKEEEKEEKTFSVEISPQTTAFLPIPNSNSSESKGGSSLNEPKSGNSSNQSSPQSSPKQITPILSSTPPPTSFIISFKLK